MELLFNPAELPSDAAGWTALVQKGDAAAKAAADHLKSLKDVLKSLTLRLESSSDQDKSTKLAKQADDLRSQIRLASGQKAFASGQKAMIRAHAQSMGFKLQRAGKATLPAPEDSPEVKEAKAEVARLEQAIAESSTAVKSAREVYRVERLEAANKRDAVIKEHEKLLKKTVQARSKLQKLDPNAPVPKERKPRKVRKSIYSGKVIRLHPDLIESGVNPLREGSIAYQDLQRFFDANDHQMVYDHYITAGGNARNIHQGVRITGNLEIIDPPIDVGAAPEQESGSETDGAPEKESGSETDGAPEQESGSETDGAPEKESGSETDGAPEKENGSE